MVGFLSRCHVVDTVSLLIPTVLKGGGGGGGGGGTNFLTQVSSNSFRI